MPSPFDSADDRAASLQSALGAAVERVRELEALAEALNQRLAVANQRADAAEAVAAALMQQAGFEPQDFAAV